MECIDNGATLIEVMKRFCKQLPFRDVFAPRTSNDCTNVEPVEKLGGIQNKSVKRDRI
jgi:hypothetical protein